VQGIEQLNLKDLMAFVAVCDTGHFAQAAASLHMSPSALSRSVRALEDWCGAALLVRTSRRAQPTREGRELLLSARRLLEEAEAFRSRAKLTAGGMRGRLLVGYMDVSISDFLPELVARHRQSNPDVEIELRYGWRAQQRAEVLDRRLDIAFTVGALPDRELMTRKVRDYPLELVVPVRHCLAEQSIVSLLDVFDQAFVWGDRSQWASLREIVDRLLEEHGIVPRVVHEAPTRDAIFGLVAAGVGITIYPRIAGLSIRSDLKAVPLAASKAEMSVYASWLRNPPLIVKEFVDQLELSEKRAS
jgi:DNA-binding transcriptional LysR family regulator